MANKRQRFETSDVIKMLDSSTEDAVMCGSDDEFDDFDEEDTDPLMMKEFLHHHHWTIPVAFYHLLPFYYLTLTAFLCHHLLFHLLC